MSFKKFNQSGKLRKVLQMGALVAEAGSKGSAGNVASKIVESKLDLSDFRKRKLESNGTAPGPNESTTYIDKNQ
tara:strand:- start:41 stop:262 length:222 start_codon:yes stop_codon:yes gene_type:complete